MIVNEISAHGRNWDTRTLKMTNVDKAEGLIKGMVARRDEEIGRKMSLIRLVAEHRDNCSPTCGISLCLILDVAERAAIKFTDEERAMFF